MGFKFYLIPLVVFVMFCLSCEKETTEPEITTPEYKITNYVMPAGDQNLHYSVLLPENYSAEEELPLILALHYGGPLLINSGRNFITALSVSL